MNYPMEPYTDQEIQDRLEKVKRQIAGLTHGLLESTTSGVFPNSLAFGERIPFLWSKDPILSSDGSPICSREPTTAKIPY
jgi:hypothetical protein